MKILMQQNNTLGFLYIFTIYTKIIRNNNQITLTKQCFWILMIRTELIYNNNKF